MAKSDKVKPAIKGNKCRVVCDYHDERRPYTARDVGRIACTAMRDGATWVQIKQAAMEKCGVGDVECDCDEIEEKLKSLAEALELIIEIAIVAIPMLAAVGKLLKTLKVAKVAAKDVQKVEDLITSSRVIAEKHLKETQEILAKMMQEAKPIVIKP